MDRGEGALRRDIYALLMKLRVGGSIVPGRSCTAEEIALARLEYRIYVDKDGFGYVYLPPKASR